MKAERTTTANKARPIPLFTQICLLTPNDHFFRLIPNQSHNKCIGIQIELTIINFTIISVLNDASPRDKTTNK